MHEGCLSKDRNRINAAQRARRASMKRIDYMPCPAAVAVMEAKRARAHPGSVDATHSAVLDAILSEWAELTGIKYRPKSKPMTSAIRPELSDHKRARAYNFGAAIAAGRFVGACAKVSGKKGHESTPRVPCGARRRRDGLPCQALSVPGKRRCRWHGGASTGPRTDEGRARSLENLRQYKGCDARLA
jgi:hypothetical protein